MNRWKLYVVAFFLSLAFIAALIASPFLIAYEVAKEKLK